MPRFKAPFYDAIGDAPVVDGVVDVPAAVGVALGLELISEPVEPPAAPTRDELIAKFLSQSAKDIIEQVNGVNADGLDTLKATRDAEIAGKNRSTVVAALDEHIAALAPPQE
jgi:hypothetical protein